MALCTFWITDPLDTVNIRHSVSHFDMKRGAIAYCGQAFRGQEHQATGNETPCSLCVLEMALRLHGRIHGTTIHELEGNYDGEAA